MRRIKQFRIGKIIPFCLLFFLFCLVSNGYSQTNVMERLIENLKSQNLKVREEAAETLGWIKDKRAVKPLIAILKDKDEDIGVREKAAKALGKIKDDKAIEALIAVLKDEDVDMRWRNAEDYKRYGRNVIAGFVLDDPTKLEGGYTINTSKDKYDNYRYIFAFAEDEEGVIISTTNITVPDPRNVSTITFDLSNPDKNYVVEKERSLRKAAAWALARIGKPAVAALITVLKDKDINVQRNAAWALGEIKDEKAREALTAALKDENLIVLAGAYKFFLDKSMPDAENILIRALKEHGDKVMAEAFLNCGNSELETAAREWAEQHHHKIIFSLK